MDIPGTDSKIWSELLTGTAKVDFEFLAIKLAFGRLSAQVKRDPSTLPLAAGEFRNVFVETARLPMSQRDLAKVAK